LADRVGTITKMVPTDDSGLIIIQAISRDFFKVVSKEAETLPQHWPIDHAIDLEPRYNWPYG
jgi:hypothetical protein